VHRSQPCAYPRWANRDGGDSASPKKQEQEEPEKASNGNDTVWLDRAEDGNPNKESSSASPPSDNGDGNENGNTGESDPPPSPPPPPPSAPPASTTITKQSVPEIYPQVLALPIARRPLFPGFYKAVVVRNPAVVAAIKEMMKRGQPYLGAFLLKDDSTDSDIITDINSVHDVGVFAQITSVFAANTPGGKDGTGVEEGLTAVLYPHRRIRITELVKAGGGVAPSVVGLQAEEGEALPTPPASPVLDAEVPASSSSVSPQGAFTPLSRNSILKYNN
jgi:Lon-like ATP-dependent protease